MATVPDRSGNTPTDPPIPAKDTSGRTDVFEYMFSDNIVDPPNAGSFRVNKLPTKDATLLRISKQTATGIDVAISLRYRVEAGKSVIVHDKDKSNDYTAYMVKSSPAVKEEATYFEIPVSLREHGSELNVQRVMVTVI